MKDMLAVTTWATRFVSSLLQGGSAELVVDGDFRTGPIYIYTLGNEVYDQLVHMDDTALTVLQMADLHLHGS